MKSPKGPFWVCSKCGNRSWIGEYAARQNCLACADHPAMERVSGEPPSICGICHNRGVYADVDGTQRLCDCPAAEALHATEVVQARLRTVYSARDAQFWMESRIPALGMERPIHLLRKGRAEEVLAVVDRIPGIASRERDG